ncbi:hypothetical protein BKA70DRAFT_52761 [Coprinopsis sp. MPI-PUGE-AT-0042]|nr:hypothetical protein BKA70DRAFT_52761 [Coprinopsis sp. MPI-PUGE-AT-0042]
MSYTSPSYLVHPPKQLDLHPSVREPIDPLEFRGIFSTNTPALYDQKHHWLDLVISHWDIRRFDACTLQGKKVYSISTPLDSDEMPYTTLTKHLETGSETRRIAMFDWKCFGEPIRIRCPQWGTGDRWTPAPTLIKGRFRNQLAGWAYRIWKESIYHYFTGPDGVEYVWRTSERSSQLFHTIKPTYLPIACVSEPTRIHTGPWERYKRRVIRFNRRASTLDLDMVMITFLIVDDKRVRKYPPNVWNPRLPLLHLHCNDGPEEKLEEIEWRRGPPPAVLSRRQPIDDPDLPLPIRDALKRGDYYHMTKTLPTTAPSISSPSSPQHVEPPSSVDSDGSSDEDSLGGHKSEPRTSDDEPSQYERPIVLTIRFQDEKGVPSRPHTEPAGGRSEPANSRHRSSKPHIHDDGPLRGRKARKSTQESLNNASVVDDTDKADPVRRHRARKAATFNPSDDDDHYPVHRQKRHASPKHAVRRSKSRNRRISHDSDSGDGCDVKPPRRRKRKGEQDEESSATRSRTTRGEELVSPRLTPTPRTHHQSLPNQKPSPPPSSHHTPKRNEENAPPRRRRLRHRVESRNIYHIPASNQPIGAPFVPSSRRLGQSAVGMSAPPKVKIRCVFPSPERGTRHRPIFGDPGPLEGILKTDESDPDSN